MSMDFDSPQARIEHEIADLRGAFPQIERCESALVHWGEETGVRYSLGLDIRWPQHQTLLAGPARSSADAAVAAAFRLARARLAGRAR